MTDTLQKHAPARDALGRLLPGHTANPRGRPKAIDFRKVVETEAFVEGIDLHVAVWKVLKSMLARAEAGDSAHFQRIFSAAPKVWILTYRSEALGDWLAPYLEDSYLSIFPNVLITGVELLPGDTVAFQNWWPGAYRLYRADGTPAETGLEIDGRRLEGPLRIEKGRHRLRLTEDKGPLYLLPADIEGVSFDMTAPREQKALFDQVYEY